MDVCRYRIASGGARVVRHRIFTSSTPILQHQSSVSHRWDRVSYDLVCRENLRRWTDPAPREYARIKSLTQCLWCGDQKAFWHYFVETGDRSVTNGIHNITGYTDLFSACSGIVTRSEERRVGKGRRSFGVA